MSKDAHLGVLVGRWGQEEVRESVEAYFLGGLEEWWE